MAKLNLKVKKLKNYPKEEFTFSPALANDAGIDLYAADAQTIPSHRRKAFKTGVAVKIPPGFFGKVFEKSGVSLRGPTSVIAGVIDADYTGEIVVLLQNDGPDPWPIGKGEKIAQIVFMPIAKPIIEIVETFEETVRGADGFGSTG